MEGQFQYLLRLHTFTLCVRKIKAIMNFQSVVLDICYIVISLPRGLETTPFAQEARLKLESVSLLYILFLFTYVLL